MNKQELYEQSEGIVDNFIEYYINKSILEKIKDKGQIKLILDIQSRHYTLRDNEYNFILSQEQWRELRHIVDNFYRDFDDEEIQKKNLKYSEDLQNDLNSILFSYSKPKTKNDKSKNTNSSGYVYLIAGRDYYKIGQTMYLEKRVKSISRTLPFDVTIVHKIKTNNRFKLEKEMHNEFSNKNVKGEWFDLNDNDIEYIKKLDGDKNE